jgi:hypothetical protein
MVALTVTWGFGGGFGTPDRVGPGLLAYLWMQAALIAPWIIPGRLLIATHGPEWLVLVLGFGMVLTMFIAAGRVMRVVFGLSSLGLGIFVAIAGSAVSYAVDRLFGMII